MSKTVQIKYGVNVFLAVGFLVAFIVMIYLLVKEIKDLNRQLDEIKKEARKITSLLD